MNKLAAAAYFETWEGCEQNAADILVSLLQNDTASKKNRLITASTLANSPFKVRKSAAKLLIEKATNSALSLNDNGCLVFKNTNEAIDSSKQTSL